MNKIFMLSGLSKNMKFPDGLKGILQKELKGLKNMVGIASTPEQFEINDMFFFGNEKVNSIISMFEGVNPEFCKYDLIDSRTSEDDAVELLNKADLLYLMPGDPYKQLEFLNLHTKIKSSVQNFKKVIVGVSAGTMNMAKKAYYLADEDYPNSQFYDALGITDITVVPHFIPQDRTIEMIRDSFFHDIYGLPETSMITIINGEIKFTGESYHYDKGNITIINKEKKLSEREEI